MSIGASILGSATRSSTREISSFGHIDSVVIVPQNCNMDVLVTSEDTFERERGMREELRLGVSVTEANAKYQSL
ncbi:MAG: hypothetical protein U0Q18_02505 [Bryobacteraceae bacterium]